MTTSSISGDLPGTLSAAEELRTSLRRLARAAARYAEARRDSLTEQIKGVVEPSTATDRAVVEGLRAWVTGGNPVMGALRGAWQGAGGKTKVAIVAILVLVAVLAPVLLLLLALAALIIAIVLKVRARTPALA